MEIPNTSTRPAGIPADWKDPAGTRYPFKAAWFYRNQGGEPVGIVARFDNDSGKQVVPFFKPGGGGKFKAGGPQAPVLFGLEGVVSRNPRKFRRSDFRLRYPSHSVR